MYLENLSITGYKNIAFSELNLSSSLNCFVGSNGAGKTNVLDAVHYLSLTKSAFSTDPASVAHGSDFFILRGHYRSHGEELPSVITTSFKRLVGKRVMSGSKVYDRLSDHIGRFPLVMITPHDSALISESPEYRRRFLNAFLSQVDSYYLSLMMRYNSFLASRNAALKGFDGQVELIEILSEQLSEVGSKVHALRSDYIALLAPIVAKFYALISGSSESIELSYRSKLNGGSMVDLLALSLERDLVMGYTSVGIHRDDIVLTMDGYPIRTYGSQGQQKSLLLALKLAEATLIGQHCGRKCLLLLDDVFDKLDMSRVENLVALVASGDFGQIFITDSNKVRLEGIVSRFDSGARIFELDRGSIRVL